MRRGVIAAALALLHLAASAEVALFDVMLNGAPRGNFNLVLDNGAYFIAPEDLEQIGLTTKGVARTIEGQVVWPVTELEGVTATIDENALEVRFTTEADRLDVQRISLANISPYGLTPADTSFISNLRMSVDSDMAGRPVMVSENALRHGAWLLQGNYYAQGSDWSPTLLRLSRDFPARMERLSVGDIPSDSYLPPMRGVWYGRAFEMKPYFQRVPGLSLTAEAPVPAVADVYVDGIRVRSINVKPGPLAMSELATGSGLHATEVVLRDRAGNVLATFSDQRYLPGEGLAAGVSDYASGFGRTHHEGAARQEDWGYSLRYARGLSDAVTLGAFAQGTLEGAQYTGAQATVVLGNWGAVSAQATQASGSASGLGLAAAVTRQAPGGSVQFQAERYSTGFYGPLDLTASMQPKSAYSGRYQVSGPAGLVVSFSAARTEQQNGAISNSFGASVGKRWGPVNITLRGTMGHGPLANPGVSLMLSYDLGMNQSAGSYVSTSRGEVISGAEYSSMGSRQRGLGYRLSTQRIGDEQDARYAGQYLHERFTSSFTAETNGREARGGLSLAGAMAWTKGDGFRFSRPVDGAFAVVDAGLPNVRVLMDNQYMGRTGDDGRLLVPYLANWADHGLTLDEQNIPLDYAVDTLTKRVSLPEKAGVVVDFNVHRAQALSGRLVDSQGKPLGATRVALSSGRAELRLSAGPDGRFYAEEAGPGHYEGALVLDGRPCRLALRVPERKTSLLEVGDVSCSLY